MNRTLHVCLLSILVLVVSFTVGCSGDPEPSTDASSDADATADAGDVEQDTAPDADGGADSGADADADTDDYTARYFEAVDGVRGVLRESPDHLHGRADRLVEAGDAEAMWTFVRERIALVPSVDGAFEPSFDDSATAVLSGPRGALRSGAGTMRDRAELLAQLYRRAGWDAEVVGPLPDGITRSDYEAVLFSPVSHEFSLPEQSAAMDRAAQIIPNQDTETGELTFVEADTSGLESTLLDEIPEAERGSIAADERSMLALPIVRLERGGEILHLDVVSPDASFEDVSSASGLDAMSDADYADVHVRLSFVSTQNPSRWEPVIDRVWQADQLVGRQLKLRYRSGRTIEETFAMSTDSIEVTTPILFAQDPELSATETLDLSEFGTPFTLTGSRITT